MRARLYSDDGAALLVTIVTMALLAAVGAGLVLVTTTDTRAVSAHERGDDALYAAETGIQLAMAALRRVAVLEPVLDGRERSPFVDGPPGGIRELPGRAPTSLDALTSLLRCRRARPCTETEMNASTVDRPWGANNPRWQPYVYGTVAGLLGGVDVGASAYIVVWVGDDPAEDDGSPFVDDPRSLHPGHAVLVLHAEAFVSGGQHRVLEATVERAGHGIRMHSWKELR